MKAFSPISLAKWVLWPGRGGASKPADAVPPSIPDCGRELAHWNALNTKERRKARARVMRSEMGLPALDALK